MLRRKSLLRSSAGLVSDIRRDRRANSLLQHAELAVRHSGFYVASPTCFARKLNLISKFLFWGCHGSCSRDPGAGAEKLKVPANRVPSRSRSVPFTVRNPGRKIVFLDRQALDGTRVSTSCRSRLC